MMPNECADCKTRIGKIEQWKSDFDKASEGRHDALNKITAVFRDNEKTMWARIDEKVDKGSFWKIVTVMITILMSTIAFINNQNSKLRGELDAYKDKVFDEIGEIKDVMSSMNASFNGRLSSIEAKIDNLESVNED